MFPFYEKVATTGQVVVRQLSFNCQEVIWSIVQPFRLEAFSFDLVLDCPDSIHINRGLIPYYKTIWTEVFFQYLPYFLW